MGVGDDDAGFEQVVDLRLGPAHLREHFDGVLAMYHDQGLAPFKALSFGHGVNYTAGLPIVRTSPDHGTGMDIAGKNLADEGSFRHAVWLGLDIIQNRERWKKMSANPLQPQKKERGGE